MQQQNEPKAFTSANGGDGEVGMDPIEPVQTNNVRPECFSSTFQEVLFVLTATMAIAMGVLVVGSVTVTSSFIGRDLDMTTAQITWITAANSLTNGAFLLFFGKIADLFGMPYSRLRLPKASVANSLQAVRCYSSAQSSSSRSFALRQAFRRLLCRSMSSMAS